MLSLAGHAIAYRWRSLPSVHWHRACTPQGSSCKGCCLSRSHHGPINVRLPVPHPLLVWSGHVESVGRMEGRDFAQRPLTRSPLHSQLDRRTQLLLLENTQMPFFESIPTELCVCVCVCVCVFIKLHITTQSGPVILVILCHSCVCVCVFVYLLNCT